MQHLRQAPQTVRVPHLRWQWPGEGRAVRQAHLPAVWRKRKAVHVSRRAQPPGGGDPQHQRPPVSNVSRHERHTKPLDRASGPVPSLQGQRVDIGAARESLMRIASMRSHPVDSRANQGRTPTAYRGEGRCGAVVTVRRCVSGHRERIFGATPRLSDHLPIVADFTVPHKRPTVWCSGPRA